MVGACRRLEVRVRMISRSAPPGAFVLGPQGKILVNRGRGLPGLGQVLPGSIAGTNSRGSPWVSCR